MWTYWKLDENFGAGGDGHIGNTKIQKIQASLPQKKIQKPRPLEASYLISLGARKLCALVSTRVHYPFFVGSGPCGSSWIGRRFQWHQTFWGAKLSFFLKNCFWGVFYYTSPSSKKLQVQVPWFEPREKIFPEWQDIQKAKKPIFFSNQLCVPDVLLFSCYHFNSWSIQGRSLIKSPLPIREFLHHFMCHSGTT
jgi:hypothetical protein